MFWIYTRRSTAGQGETSDQVQEEYCRRQAEILGEKDITVINEVGSGSSLETRPKFRELITKSQAGDIIACYDSSRFARNTEDSLAIARMLNFKGVKIRLGDKFMDIDSPIDKMLMTIQAGFDTYQRELHNKKANDGRKKQYDNGDAVFTGNLMGYEHIKKGRQTIITVIDEEVKVIKYLFEKYAEGWSVPQLSKKLYGTPLKRGFILDSLTIRRTLLRPIYMGYYLGQSNLSKQMHKFSEEEVRGMLIRSNLYPPIISEDLWWKVFRSYRRVHYPNVRPFETRFTKSQLSGVIRCPVCNKGISFLNKDYKSRTLMPQYIMQTHTPVCTQPKTCYAKDWLENVVKACFAIVFLSGAELSVFFKEKENELYEDTKEFKDAIRAIDRQIGEISNKIQRLILAVAEGALTTSDVRPMRENLERERSGYEARKKDLEDQLSAKTMESELWLEVSAKEILEQYLTDQRTLLLKYVKEGYGYPKYLTLEFMNTKRFEITRASKRNSKMKPCEIKVSHNGEFQFSFIYDHENMTLTVKDVNAIEEAQEWARQEWNGILGKARLFLIDGIILI